MRTFKRLFLLLLLLAVVGLVGTQWWVRSPAGVSSFERRIKASTGLETEIDSARLGWNFDFLMTDVSLVLKDAEHGDQIILEAPAISVSGRCHKRVFKFSRPVIKAVQSQRGEWAPSQLKDFADRDAFFEALLAVSASVETAFEITDAVLVMQGTDGKEIVSYSGVNWYHAAVPLKGRPGLMHNMFSLQCIDGKPVSLASEWLSDGQETCFLGTAEVVSGSELSLVEKPIEEVYAADKTEAIVPDVVIEADSSAVIENPVPDEKTLEQEESENE